MVQEDRGHLSDHDHLSLPQFPAPLAGRGLLSLRLDLGAPLSLWAQQIQEPLSYLWARSGRFLLVGRGLPGDQDIQVVLGVPVAEEGMWGRGRLVPFPLLVLVAHKFLSVLEALCNREHLYNHDDQELPSDLDRLAYLSVPVFQVCLAVLEVLYTLVVPLAPGSLNHHCLQHPHKLEDFDPDPPQDQDPLFLHLGQRDQGLQKSLGLELYSSVQVYLEVHSHLEVL